jgi:cytochrome oxidase Cu insertion factor (SCO1/SenC/PrrC family)
MTLRRVVLTFIALQLVVACAAAQGGNLPPAAATIPKVGEMAPDFTLPDQNGNPVKLNALLGESKAGKNSPAALLIFYRGYW